MKGLDIHLEESWLMCILYIYNKIIHDILTRKLSCMYAQGVNIYENSLTLAFL